MKNSSSFLSAAAASGAAVSCPYYNSMLGVGWVCLTSANSRGVTAGWATNEITITASAVLKLPDCCPETSADRSYRRKENAYAQTAISAGTYKGTMVYSPLFCRIPSEIMFFVPKHSLQKEAVSDGRSLLLLLGSAMFVMHQSIPSLIQTA